MRKLFSKLKKTTLLSGLIVATFLTVQPEHALLADAPPVEGGLLLSGLPRQAFIYLDGVRVAPEKNRLRVPSGKHQLQIETTSGEQVLATVLDISVEANKTVIVPLQLRPVYSGFIHVMKPGSQGPPGPSGPPGEPKRATAYSPEEAEKAILDEMRYSVEELKGRIARLRNSVPVTHEVESYCAGECRLEVGPPYPSGPSGPPGLPATAVDIYTIRDHEGRTLITESASLLNLPRLQKMVAEFEKQVEARPAQPLPRRAVPIKVLSADLQPVLRAQKQRGDEYERALRAGEVAAGDAIGPRGPRGPRGTAEPVAENSIAEVLLTAAQTQQLIKRLRDDTSLKRELAEIEHDIRMLNFAFQ